MRVVILAAGDFPKQGGEGERLLKSADAVIACDSAAKTFRRRFGCWPEVTIGDMDSFKGKLPPNVVKVPEQETNDLQKAIDYLTTFYKKWAKDAVIVGATGKREDHTIGNIYRALEAQLKVVTNDGVFYPIGERLELSAFPDQGVSIFTIDPNTRMESEGLVWPLGGVKFVNPYVATLNRAAGDRVCVRSTHPALLYLADHPRARQVVVALGSNLGNRRGYLKEAKRLLAALPKTRLVDESAIVETEGVDVPREFAQLKFLNQILLFESLLEPQEFSARMHAIEDKLGRVRTVKNGPRTIDIDLIQYGEVVMNTPELILPHPRAKDRSFVTEPLSTIGLSL